VLGCSLLLAWASLAAASAHHIYLLPAAILLRREIHPPLALRARLAMTSFTGGSLGSSKKTQSISRTGVQRNLHVELLCWHASGLLL
jgi:hypothetical protein